MNHVIILPSATITALDQPEVYKRFMQGYLQLLRDNLIQQQIMDQRGELVGIKYSCGQEHHSRNPNWKPFQYLERYCRKCGYDDLEARDIIEEHIGRRLTCECELITG